MLGNILLGGYILGTKQLGIFVVEEGPNVSQSTQTTVSRFRATFSSLPEKPRDPTKDREISASYSGLNPRTVSNFYAQFDEFGTTCYVATKSVFSARFIAPEIAGTGYVPIINNFYGIFDIKFVDDNTIMWSDIGNMSFDITQSNMAGKMPLEWRGYVFQVAKLGDFVYAYGENGITRLTPSGVFYGQKTLSKNGLKGKHAFCSTGEQDDDGKEAHYFIMNNNYFCKLDNSKGINKLGYTEFMSTLTNPVLSYDNQNNNIYICDVNNGYVYSIDNDSLGKGEKAITGVFFQDNEMRLFSSVNTTSLGSVNICTDTYDLGTRKVKTIFKLEIGTDYDGLVECSIDYRFKKEDSFSTIPYKMVNPSGFVEIPCQGIEFRFRLRADLGERYYLKSFKLDYIKVDGVVQGFSFLDTVTMK